MRLSLPAPWHKASWDRLIAERLPELLAGRLPLVGYEVEPSGNNALTVGVTLATATGDLEVAYKNIPAPDADGVFDIEGVRRVVVPLAKDKDLAHAEISCAGEQIYGYIEKRLGEAPPDLPWDEALARVWLPLDEWIGAFFATEPTSQLLDQTNWLATTNHLRRLVIDGREPGDPRPVFGPGHLGRVCPFEMPEGPNMGRIFVIATGATIHDRRLVVVDESPEAALGVSAACTPLLEHDDPNRLLMGTNMMRQWLRPPDPEPALVQSGNEPDAPDFWCGRNLLTAFVAWGAETFEDGIVISASCARKLNYPTPVETGDKLSTRHGTKGVVSAILPDGDMPQLADGTPVEIVYNFISLHARLVFGVVREAILGRLARIDGTPVIAPPFQATDADTIRARLAAAGLPTSGMETLRLGRDGEPGQRPSTAGWVYWGRLFHLAQDKLAVTVTGDGGQHQGELEYAALREAGAVENIREQFNTRAAGQGLPLDHAVTLAARVAAGPVQQADPPTPAYSAVADRLAVAGINATFDDGALRFNWSEPHGDTLRLAQPVPHPWLHERQLTEIGVDETLADYRALRECNRRLERVLTSQAPASLREQASEQLVSAVNALFATLLTPEHLRLDTHVLFSGRAVLAPGPTLRIDQLGIADEIAWRLYGPLVVHELGDEAAVTARNQRATAALDTIMAQSWILVNRAPSLSPTAFLAFHPVRLPERVIRLHPLACRLLDADFDGDQAALFLPLTAEAQSEAGELLSIAGHLRRDPILLEQLLPSGEALWGLAWLTLTPAGKHELTELTGEELALPEGVLTRMILAQAMARHLRREGVDATLAVLEQLTQRGFAIAQASGASLSPFPATALAADDAWRDAPEQFVELLASRTDWEDQAIGPQLLAIRSCAWGTIGPLSRLVGVWEPVADMHGNPFQVRHSYAEGLRPAELYTVAVVARDSLARLSRHYHRAEPSATPRGFNVLARAMRAAHPGVVFARAAAIGEVEPLADPDSRHFVGLK